MKILLAILIALVPLQVFASDIPPTAPQPGGGDIDQIFDCTTGNCFSTITLSANTKVLLDEANFAGWREKLDLEVGTDFYSITAADTAHESATSNDFNPDRNACDDVNDNKLKDDCLADLVGWLIRLHNDESADAVLANLGEAHVRGDEDRFSLHLGSGGEIAGEATMSFLEPVSITFDPGAWYASDTQVFLFTIGKEAPNGIIIDLWKISCNVDPDVEPDLDLKYADAWIGLGSPNVIDVLDTTNGVASEDTDANINGGAAIVSGKVIYLEFDSDPDGTCDQMIFEMLYHAEED